MTWTKSRMEVLKMEVLKYVIDFDRKRPWMKVAQTRSPTSMLAAIVLHWRSIAGALERAHQQPIDLRPLFPGELEIVDVVEVLFGVSALAGQ